jgi:hypothetical protein
MELWGCAEICDAPVRSRPGGIRGGSGNDTLDIIRVMVWIAFKGFSAITS